MGAGEAVGIVVVATHVIQKLLDRDRVAARIGRVGKAEQRIDLGVGLQLLGPRAGGEIVHRAGQSDQVHLVGAVHHRHDQPVLVRHGDPEVDVALQHDGLVAELAVDVRERQERLAH